MFTILNYYIYAKFRAHKCCIDLYVHIPLIKLNCNTITRALLVASIDVMRETTKLN